jgi:excisionase family DNA binding protein
MTSSSGKGDEAPVIGSIDGARAERSEQLADVRFLTVAEVATMMRVSKMTVYRIVHAGELPAVRVGRSFRVPEKAVHDYLQAAFIEAG